MPLHFVLTTIQSRTSPLCVLKTAPRTKKELCQFTDDDFSCSQRETRRFPRRALSTELSRLTAA